MPKRTVSFATVQFKKDKKREAHSLDDVRGVPLLDRLEQFARTHDPDELRNDVRQSYVAIGPVTRANRCVLLELEGGSFGEAKQVIDSRTHQRGANLSEDDVAPSFTRLALIVPPGADEGLFFVEHYGLHNGGGRVMDLFKSEFLNGPGAQDFLPIYGMAEAAAWLEEAQLDFVEVVAKRWHEALDGDDEVVTVPFAKMTRTLQPLRGDKFLPGALKDAIINRKLNVATYVGFEYEEEVDVVLGLSTDEASKRVIVGRERLPTIHRLLADDREPRPDNTAFLDFVADLARNYYEDVGHPWEASWVDDGTAAAG